MDSLASLITKPLEAASAVLQTAAAAAAGPAAGAAAAAPGQQGNATFTEDTLRMLLYNLFHGDARLQQQACQQYYAPDVAVSFNEGALALSDQEQFVQLLRGLQLLAKFKPEVLEITSTPNKAVILLNLNISYKLLPPTWWFPLPAPATITLTFGRPAGVTNVIPGSDDVITAHHQEMSLFELLMWNPAWEWAAKRFWRPVSGQVLSKLHTFEEPLVNRTELAGH